MWIFGYGSLMWRPGFPYRRREPALANGWARRFWQGSPDHRGTPARPGRVVTLARAAESRCVGIAYELDRADYEATLSRLDLREIGGYDQTQIAVSLADGAVVSALTYIAGSHNPNFLGPGPLEGMVSQILASAGVSGDNADYVMRLDEVVVALGGIEQETRELADAVRTALNRQDRDR